MVQRTALFAASLVAALALAVGIAVAGFAPGHAAAVPAAAEPAAAVTDAPAQPTVQVDTVYLAPKAEPVVITMNRTQPASHGDDGENEGDDD